MTTYLPPASRYTDPPTSHLAEEAITKDGSRETMQQKVLATVRAHPGATCSEIADILGVHRSAISKRLPEVEASLPQPIRRGVAREGLSGRKELTWWPVMEGTQGWLL